MKRRNFLVTATTFSSIAAFQSQLLAQDKRLTAMATPKEAQAIAKEAYIYAYAMLENYKTMYKQVVNQSAPEYVGGFGTFRHYSEVYTPANRDVVTPNNDTPYSWAWLDLRAEPWVFSVPAVPKDRYYSAQCIDLFTHNFAYIGGRATGFEAGNYLFASPKWKGTKPFGIKQVFQSETDLILMLIRVQLNGADDVSNVRAIQKQLKLTSLSKFLGKSSLAVVPTLKFPAWDIQKAASHDFIGYLDFLLQFCQPTHPSEVALMQRFAKIGIRSGASFKATAVNPNVLTAIDAGVKDGQITLDAAVRQFTSSNGLFGTREFLKNDYLKRAVGAAAGLYGNSIEEAWYGGYPGDGGKLQTISFPTGQLPPAQFFWSITIYELPDRFLVENPIDRYSIGDRTQGLKYSKDGSLTIYISHKSPGADKESNWLPAPKGRFTLVVRIYGPSQSAIDGTWKLPPLKPAV